MSLLLLLLLLLLLYYSSMYAGFKEGASSASLMSSDDEGLNLAACEPGTDCTDCGVRIVQNDTCTNTCLK
jgi:hypothetical protein